MFKPYSQIVNSCARYEDGHGDPALDVREERERDRLQRHLTVLERERQRLVDAYQVGIIELTELQTRRQGQCR